MEKYTKCPRLVVPGTKLHKRFICDMSMKQFYPLVKDHLLKKALDFANTFVNLSEDK